MFVDQMFKTYIVEDGDAERRGGVPGNMAAVHARGDGWKVKFKATFTNGHLVLTSKGNRAPILIGPKDCPPEPSLLLIHLPSTQGVALPLDNCGKVKMYIRPRLLVKAFGVIYVLYLKLTRKARVRTAD